MMRRTIIMLLTVMFCLQAVCCQAEATTEQVTETEAEAGTASLVFSSFDGGGPEYWIEIEDPQIVTYTGRKEYDDPDHDMMTGSGYNDIYTFTGLKPGTTKMTVSMYSPLMESEDAVYTVSVDDNLNVTISQERTISRFKLYRYGEIHYDSYEIVTLMGDYSVSINGDDFQSIADDTVDRLFQVVGKYDLFQWDGYDESQDDVLDGEGFLLEILFTDGATIRAQGDNTFPENYFSAMGEMQEILDNMETVRTLTIGDSVDYQTGSLPGFDEWIVGRDVRFEDITDFYYTFDASTDPPKYQRYRFFAEDGKKYFYHETREGGGWPQTEEDITRSGSMELSEDEWKNFCLYVENGTVRERTESLDDGDAGPWLYLYWDGDQGEYQEFSFSSWEVQKDFEAFCEELREKS